MSAVRTRILLGDDTDLLAPARMAILSRADLDVVMAGTTEEALEIASMNPRPRAAILPAKGEIDGIEFCRRLKSSSPDTMVLLALAPGDVAARDACFLAGADDIVFAPVDAADLVARIAAARGPAFRQAPRAEVELAIHLQGSATGPVIESRGLQISVDAIAVDLPNGLQTPPPGTLVRATFTLYESGTLTVWARFAPGDAGGAAVRLVGLNEQERRSIDYFVDFYRKGATARAAVEEVTSEVTAANPAASATTTPRAPAKTQSGLPVEDLKPSDRTLHALVNADLDAIASAAALVAAGREGSATPPAGFSVLRFRTLVPKLAPAEISALRGTTMHNDILGDLRLCSGAKLRLFEMNSQIRSGAAGLSKIAVEQAVMAVIAEAQQIHKVLESALEARVKAGNTDAVRDLGPVNVGLVNACIDLKRTLDVEVLKKAATKVAPTCAPTQSRYDHSTKDDEPARPEAAKPQEGPTGKGRRIALTLVIAVGLAAAIWQNYRLLNPPAAAPFMAPAFLWAAGDAHILQEATREKAMIFVVDGTWKAAPQKDRDAALAQMAVRAALAGSSSASIVAVTGETLGTVPMTSATSPAPVETATPSL